MSELCLLSRAEALALLEEAEVRHRERGSFTPEIEEKKEEMAEAIRNADRFIATLRVVDQGMMLLVITLQRELDTLYDTWDEAERRKPTIH